MNINSSLKRANGKWALLMILIFFVSLTVGLASPSAVAAQKTTKLTVLTNPDTQGFWHWFAKEFEKDHPNINVKIIEGPHSTDKRYDMFVRPSMAGRSPYDLLSTNIVWVPKFAEKGFLLPLNKYVDINKLYGENFRKTVKGSMWKGKLYRIPYQSDAGVLYYRKDLLQEAGIEPPDTFKELISAAKKLQNPEEGLWGYIWQGAEYAGLDCDYLEMLWGNGGYYYNPKTRKVGIDSKEATEALQMLVDMIHKYKITPKDVLSFKEEESRQFFQQGKAVFLRNWPYVWSLAQKKGSKVKGKIGAKPIVHAPGLQPEAFQGGWGLSVSAFIEKDKKTAAVELAKFSSTYKIQKKLVKMWGYDVSRRAIYYDPEVLKITPYFKQLRETLKNTHVGVVGAVVWPELRDIMSEYVHKALIKQITPEKATEKMAEEARKVVKEQWGE